MSRASLNQEWGLHEFPTTEVSPDPELVCHHPSFLPVALEARGVVALQMRPREGSTVRSAAEPNPNALGSQEGGGRAICLLGD